MTQSPKISFIITGRNDNYGGFFLHRLNTSIRVLSYLTGKYHLPAELILVEYNPPPDKESLAEILKEHANQHLTIRIIAVPTEFHEEIRQESKTPFFEYIAKNIAIRRAQAPFILITNPDIVFSEALIKFLAQNELDKNSFYRANRHDMPAHGLDDPMTPEEIIASCPRLVNRAWTQYGLRYLSYKRWLNRVLRRPRLRNFLMCPLFNPIRDLFAVKNTHELHVGAAGDFTMAHHSVWERLHGFDQRPFLSFIDGYAVYNLAALGYKQIVLPFPIYHINHEESNTKRKMIDIREFHKDAQEILRTKSPKHTGPENWGFPDIQFSETQI